MALRGIVKDGAGTTLSTNNSRIRPDQISVDFVFGDRWAPPPSQGPHHPARLED